jgi:phytoene/squalene synthetase
VDFDNDLNACAALVEKGDPERFRTVMAAPVAARAKLFVLYAFNVEVARAPWVTQEPMIAEMRLQWWRDALEEIATNATARRHEVVTPLVKFMSPETAAMLDELVAVRRWDIYKDAFEDEAHFDRYIDQTAGHLMVAATRSLGAADEHVVRDVAYAAGIAAWLCAVPKLETAKRVPLLDGRPEGVQELAAGALKRLQNARASKAKISKDAQPALWPVVGADQVLRQAVRDPMAVAEGRLDTRSKPLVWAALLGRW